MFQISGIFLTAIVCVVVTGLREKSELLLEMKTVKNETDSKLKQLMTVRNELQELEDKIVNATADLDLQRFKFSAEQKDILSNIYRLNTSVATLEKSINTNKALLDTFKLTLLEVNFNVKMLTQEVNFYQKRKDDGDDKTCFYFKGIKENSTQPLESNLTADNASAISARRFLRPNAMSSLILETKLNKAKLELLIVEQSLLMANAKLSAGKQFYEKLKTTSKKIVDSLVENLSSAKTALETLKAQEKTKKIEDVSIDNELNKTRNNIAASMETTLALEKKLEDFKQAIECYNKLKSE